jgi:uncharacterized protein YbaP (TraB family)
MSLRALLALAGALLLAACGEPARDWPEPSPALWEVTSREGQRGWLFGTIHALPAEVRWRTPALEEALADSGVLVVEVADLGDADKAAAAFDRYARGDGLPPLSRRVEPEDRADLAAFLDRADSSEGDFARLDTWAAALVAANRARRLDGSQNVDRALIAEAGEVVGLESYAVQYAMFDALPAEEQADLLMALARDSGGEVGRIEAWLSGDLAALEAAGEALLADPELRAALQTDRNLRWAPIIAELVERGRRPLVAVGTGHLFGPQSLPALLEARGYAVRRVQ